MGCPPPLPLSHTQSHQWDGGREEEVLRTLKIRKGCLERRGLLSTKSKILSKTNLTGQYCRREVKSILAEDICFQPIVIKRTKTVHMKYPLCHKNKIWKHITWYLFFNMAYYINKQKKVVLKKFWDSEKIK